MEDEDEKSYLNADSAILKIGSRPTLLIISSTDGKTFIHTDSNSQNVYAIIKMILLNKLLKSI